MSSSFFCKRKQIEFPIPNPIQIFTATSRHYSTKRLHDVVIVAATRTPIGSFQSSLSPLSATQLGGIAIESVVKQAGIAPSDVNEVYMGNVCAAGLGQAPARQAAIFGGTFIDSM